MAAPINDNIKQKIINATIQLLEKKSFKEISLTEISEKLDISKGSIYYYFRSKNEILYAVEDSFMNNLYEALMQWYEQEGKNESYSEIISHIIERGCDLMSGTLRFHLVMEAIDGDEIIREKMVSRYEAFEETIGDFIISKLPEDAAKRLLKASNDDDIGRLKKTFGHLIISTMDGLSTRQSMRPDEYIRESVTNIIISMIR